MVAAAPPGGLGRCVAHFGGAWRASVRRRLCRAAVADLSGRARLQRLAVGTIVTGTLVSTALMTLWVDWIAALFARYSVIGSCATALGVLAAAFPDYAAAWTGCSCSTAMQLMFGLYAFLGLGAFLLYRPLSPAVEVADRTPEAPL